MGLSVTYQGACPRCGTPARHVEMLARVACVLEKDGTVGRVLWAVNRHGKPLCVCGGGHKWNPQREERAGK